MQGVKLASKTEIKAPLILAQGDRLIAIRFIREKLNDYDLSKLSEIKFAHKPYDSRKNFSNVWGDCKYPWILGKTDKVKYTYRISARVRGEDDGCRWKYSDFPRVRRQNRRYGFNGMYPGQIYNTIAELMVFIIGHEIYHYLCNTEQLPHSDRDEKRADTMGDDWVKKYREWRNASV